MDRRSHRVFIILDNQDRWYFFEWAPPAAETLRMLIGTFLEFGMSAEDITTMVRTNPARLLGWDDIEPNVDTAEPSQTDREDPPGIA
jgi:hypothetical protein